MPDYNQIKDILALVSVAGTLIVGVGGWLIQGRLVSRKEFHNNAQMADSEIGAVKNRIEIIETKIEQMPTHQDITGIKEALSELKTNDNWIKDALVDIRDALKVRNRD